MDNNVVDNSIKNDRRSVADEFELMVNNIVLAYTDLQDNPISGKLIAINKKALVLERRTGKRVVIARGHVVAIFELDSVKEA